MKSIGVKLLKGHSLALTLCVVISICLHVVVCLSVLDFYQLKPISDEGSYVSLAKSLAVTGQYKSIWLSGDPDHTKYPILFPLVLSTVWKLQSSFPDNIVLFRLVGLLFNVGHFFVLAAVARGLWKLPPGLTAALIGVCALHPAFLACSVNIWSESAYLLFSGLVLLSVYSAERGSKGNLYLVLAAVWTACALYVRIAGLALLGAVAIHFFLRRKWKELSLFIGVTAALMLPLVWWSTVHNPSERFPEFAFDSSYTTDFRSRLESEGWVSVVAKNGIYLFLGVPKAVIYPFEADLTRLTTLTGWVGLPVWAVLVIGFCRSWRSDYHSVTHYYVLAYMALLLVWPYPAGERFLLPMLPIFCAVVLAETRALMGASTRAGLNACVKLPSQVAWGGVLIVWALTFGLHVTTFLEKERVYIKHQEDHSGQMLMSFEWIRQHSQRQDVVAANLPSLCYLYADRKTTPLVFDLTRGLSRPKFVDAALKKHRVKYLILSQTDFAIWTPDVIEKFRWELRQTLWQSTDLVLKKVFSTAQGEYEIYEIFWKD
jgi:hypothetical protein